MPLCRFIRCFLAFLARSCSQWSFVGLYLSLLIVCSLLLQRDALAAVASQFSLSVGEEYNDNIFFTKDKEHDFITHIFPTFSLFYAPAGQTVPVFTADFTPIGQIFADHSEESNFGDNIRFRTSYIYRYSPRVTFHAADTLRRLGQTRTAFGDEFLTGSPGFNLSPQSQELDDFISRGDQLTNRFSLGARYEHTPNLSFTGDYDFGYTTFLDAGGRDLSHSVGARGFYRWREEHNLHAGYSISIIKSRNGDDNIVHNFDIGDDYFSSLKIDLSPTLTILTSAGVGLNSNSSGPGISGRVNVTAIKIWERATLRAGVRKGLTPSFGVGGISDTTSFFTAFNIRITEFLTGIAAVDYSLYDTDDVNFNTFQASTGLQYRFTSWLSSTLGYAHRRRDAGSGAASTDLLEQGTVNSNSVFLFFTSRFDVWPSIGLARGQYVP